MTHALSTPVAPRWDDDEDENLTPVQDAMERMRMFLAELAALREQYKIEVGGCGECGSPWLFDLETQEDLGWHLGWSGNEYILKQGVNDRGSNR